jgi:hypothetical protein
MVMQAVLVLWRGYSVYRLHPWGVSPGAQTSNSDYTVASMNGGHIRQEIGSEADCREDSDGYSAPASPRGRATSYQDVAYIHNYRNGGQILGFIRKAVAIDRIQLTSLSYLRHPCLHRYSSCRCFSFMSL